MTITASTIVIRGRVEALFDGRHEAMQTRIAVRGARAEVGVLTRGALADE